MAFGRKSSASEIEAKALGRVPDRKAGSYLKVFEKSFSSSAIDRKSAMVSDEDMSVMTIDFLWTRLQAQRSHYKAAKQRAQVLVQKVLELEHRLRIEVQLRKQAEHQLRKQAECEILEASTPPDSKQTGPLPNLSQRVILGASLQEKCKGSHSSGLSSAQDFYGCVDDFYTDGDEGSVHRCPSPKSDHHCVGKATCKGKKSFPGLLNKVYREHRGACLNKKERIGANPADLRRIRKVQGWLPEHCAIDFEQDHNKQDEVDRSLHIHEHDETTFQCQGSDNLENTGEVSSLSKGRSSLAHEALPITNLQQPPGHRMELSLGRETCEIVEESASVCALQEAAETLVPHAMVGDDACRHLCSYDFNTRGAIQFPGMRSNDCKPPSRQAENGDLEMAFRGPQSVYPVIPCQSCKGCHAQVGSSQHLKRSGSRNIVPYSCVFECKHSGSRQITEVKGSTPRRRELGHSLSLGMVVEPVNYEPELMYSVMEMLKMLEAADA